MSDNQLETLKESAFQNRAVAILCLLEWQPADTSNESLLNECLGCWGLRVTHEMMRADLKRIEAFGVIGTELRGEENKILVCWLTQKGFDYLERRERIEGLMRIEPDCPYRIR